jgi:hypothetical protein
LRHIEGYRKGDLDMVKTARREYLEAIRRRYRKACKKDKKPILSEFCTDCGNRSRSVNFKNYFGKLFLWRNAS